MSARWTEPLEGEMSGFPPSAIKVGKIEFAPTSRIRYSNDPGLARGFNDNVHAIQELQATVLELALRLDKTEAKLKLLGDAS